MQVSKFVSANWQRRLALALPALLLGYLLSLAVSTHTPPGRLRPVVAAIKFRQADKLAHAGAYGGLTLLALATWRQHRPRNLSPGRKLVTVLSICLAIAGWGLFDELTQPYFGRHCDVLDWLSNVAGISLAVAVSALIPRDVKSWWLSAFSLR